LKNVQKVPNGPITEQVREYDNNQGEKIYLSKIQTTRAIILPSAVRTVCLHL